MAMNHDPFSKKIISQNTSESTPAEVFQAHSISYRSSGSSLRIKASWRGGNGYSVAVHSKTGGWKDHAAGDKGTFEKLCGPDYLNIDISDFKSSPISSSEEEKELSHRVAGARRLWDRFEPMEEGDFSYEYLVSRGGQELAEVALNRARIRTGISKKGKFDQASDCLIAPIIDTATAEVCGVQRIWGRGHEGKKMLGVHIPKISGSEARHSGGMQIDGTGDTLYITEGLETGLAVATATGAKVFVLFDGSGLQAVPSLKGLVATGIKKIVIAGDHDKQDEKGSFIGQKPGHRYATDCAQRLLLSGIKDVKISIPDLLDGQEKTDWLDVLVAKDKEEVARLLSEKEVGQAIDPDRLSTVQSLAWFEAAPDGFKPIKADFETLDSAQEKMEAIIKEALDSDQMTILAATVGTGKTHATARVINASDRPVLFLARTSDDARDFATMVPGCHLHEGRNEKNCLKFEALVGPIQSKSRAPYSWACQTCEHGPRDAAMPCDYMIDLRNSSYKRVVVGTHGAGAQDSTLYTYMSGAGSSDETSEKRKLVIDEEIPENVIHRIESDDIRIWRQMLSEKIPFIDPADKKAVAWATEMAAELESLAIKLAAAPTDKQLYRLDSPRFRKLGTNIPKSVRVADGTLAEAVKIPSRPGEEMIVPMRGIQALAEAMLKGTGWIHEGKIIAVTTGSLWKKAQAMGALNLNATPSLSAQTTAGVREIRVEEYGQIAQIGPVQHGRFQLGSPKRLKEESESLMEIMGKNGAAITHKPLSDSIKKISPLVEDRIGHWGRDEKAHNRWKALMEFDIWGVEIPNPIDMIILYKSYRANMREAGVKVEDWNGETSRNQIINMLDGAKITYPGPLPTVEDARVWLIDRVSGQVAQAIGRLRLCQRKDDSAQIRIHTPFPVQGHGIRIDRRITGSGRVEKKIKDVQAVAEIVSIDEHATAKEIISKAAARGHHISERAARQAARELKAEAITTGKSLHEVTENAVKEASLMLHYFPISEAIALAKKECTPATLHILEAISESGRSAIRAHAGP